MGKRGWIIAAVGLLAAITIGIVVAVTVLPSDTPKPAATPDRAVIAIDPVPSPTPAAQSVEPITPPSAARPGRAIRTERRSKPPVTPPDPDPVVVTTINSW